MSYIIKTEIGPKHIITLIEGRIGGEASVKLYREIKEIIDTNPEKDLVMDFEKVDFIDSTGLGSLVAVNSTLLRKKRKMIMAAVPANLLSLLKITNLDRILHIVKSTRDVV